MWICWWNHRKYLAPSNLLHEVAPEVHVTKSSLCYQTLRYNYIILTLICYLIGEVKPVIECVDGNCESCDDDPKVCTECKEGFKVDEVGGCVQTKEGGWTSRMVWSYTT